MLTWIWMSSDWLIDGWMDKLAHAILHSRETVAPLLQVRCEDISKDTNQNLSDFLFKQHYSSMCIKSCFPVKPH